MQSLSPLNKGNNTNAIQNDEEENIQLKVTAKNDLVKISLLPTDNMKRSPADIVCVIDISGSMGTSAAI